MTDLAFSTQILERQVLFPWLEIFFDKLLKKFPSDLDTEVLHFLIENIEKEFNSLLNEEDTRRKEILFEVIYDLFLHFWWRIRWHRKKKWKKCWKTAYSEVTYSNDQRTKCVEKLLYYIIHLGIILSNRCSESEWTEKALKALHILPSFDDMICNSLLQINNLETRYQDVYMFIVKHALCSKIAESISEPGTYVKIILLLRRLKKFTKDKQTLAAIKVAAASMKAPSDTLHWLSSLEINFPFEKHENFGKLLLGKKCPESIICLLYKIVSGRDCSNPKADFHVNESEEINIQGDVSNMEQLHHNPKESDVSRRTKTTKAVKTPSSNGKVKMRLNHKMLGSFNTPCKDPETLKKKDYRTIDNTECSKNSINKACNISDPLSFPFAENHFSESYDSESRKLTNKKHVKHPDYSPNKRIKLDCRNLEDNKIQSAKEIALNNYESDKMTGSISPDNYNLSKSIKSGLSRKVQNASVGNDTKLLNIDCKSDTENFYFDLSDSSSPRTEEVSSCPLKDSNNSRQTQNQSNKVHFKLINSAITERYASSQTCSTNNLYENNNISTEKLSNIESPSLKLPDGMVCSSALNKINSRTVVSPEINESLPSTNNDSFHDSQHLSVNSRVLEERSFVNNKTDKNICTSQNANASQCVVDCKIINGYDPDNPSNKEATPVKVFINVTVKAPECSSNPSKKYIFGTFTDAKKVTPGSSANYFNSFKVFGTKKPSSEMPQLTPFYRDPPFEKRSLDAIATTPDSELDASGSFIKDSAEDSSKWETERLDNKRICSSTPKNRPSILRPSMFTDHSDHGSTPNTSEVESSTEWNLENTRLPRSLLVINGLQENPLVNGILSFSGNKDNDSSLRSSQYEKSYRGNTDIYSGVESSDEASTVSCPSQISDSDPELTDTSIITCKGQKTSQGIPKKKAVEVFTNKRKTPPKKRLASTNLQQESFDIASKRYNLRSRAKLSRPERLTDYLAR